jgi:hypothetical protein
VLRPQHRAPHLPEQLPHRRRRSPPRLAATLAAHALPAADAPRRAQCHQQKCHRSLK